MNDETMLFRQIQKKTVLRRQNFGILRNWAGICGEIYRKFPDFIILQLILRP